MTRTEEFIRDLMADRDPAAEQVVAPPDRRYAAQRLQAAIAETATQERTAAPRASQSWWKRSLGGPGRLSVATVAVGVLAVVAALVISPGALPGAGESGRAYAATPPLLIEVDQPGTPAEQTLEELANAADQQPGLGGGEYRHLRTASWYLHTTVSDGQGDSVIIPSIIDKWLAPDGSRVVAEAKSEPVEAGPPGRLADEQARRQLPDGDFEVTRYPADSTHSWDAEGLPTDPDALHDALMDAYNDSLPEHEYLYRTLTDRLHDHRLQPELLAAYYRMLADQADMRTYGTLEDRAGREGVAVGFDSASSGLATRYMLIIDEQTGTPLGVEQVLTTDAGKLGVRVPAVIGYEVFLAGGRVDSTDMPGPDIP